MAAPRRLTTEQAALARETLTQRQQLLMRLAKLPTLEELAVQLGVSGTALKNLFRGKTYKQRA
jgi:AraC-like DNA-binding protein